MNTPRSAGRVSNLLLSIIVFVLLIAGLVAAFLFGQDRADRGFATLLEGTVKKSQIASTMQLNLLASATAEKSAVMAETDETSKEFAEESRRATAAVEADRSSLARLVETGGLPEEIERLAAFNECWTRYQDVDREILGLAVENTNLKALRLSFGPASEALDRMQLALDKVIDDAGSSPDAEVIAKSGYRAMTAALKIQTLEGRHIAEARNEEMDRIEAKMKTLDDQANDALTALSASTGDAMKASIDDARAAYAEFQKVNAEVLDMSRRNSNVRSLAISLGQKRKVTAECQDRLTALQESLRSEFPAATR